MDYRQQAEAFAEFLIGLPKPRRRVGEEVRGRCPLPEHEDKSASFGYDIVKDAWACSCGGGKGSELMGRLGFQWDGAARPSTLQVAKVTEYPLVDPSGTIVAYHIRRDYGPGQKKFSWRVPGKAQEGLHGLQKADLPLYGLPKLLDAPADRPAVLVEGEKAADLLQRLAGETAVVLATVTGAPALPRDGGPWPISCPNEAVFAPLAGRKVYLWPDHDDQGREHMRQAEERLKAVGADPVRVRWAGAKRHGDDAGDFVSRGGTAEELAGILASGGVDWRATFKALPIKATELAPLIDAPIPYIVKPIIVRGSLTQIQGIPKGGKSAFSLYLALCLSTDTWLHPTRLVSEVGRVKVLYIAWEDPKIMMAKRLSLYAAGLGLDRTFLPEDLTFLFGPDIFVEQSDHVEALKAALAELKPDVVFIDTLSHVHLADENASSEMKIPMKNLDRIARESNVGIVYLHHTGKGSADKHAQDKSRGSGAIAAAWHVLIDWGVREKGSNLNPVEVQSKYEHEWFNWGITYEPVKDDVGMVTAVRWNIDAIAPPEDENSPKAKAKARRQRIVQALRDLIPLNPPEGWVTAEQVLEKANLDMSTPNLRKLLAEFVEAGDVKYKPGTFSKEGRSPNLYRFVGGNLSDV